MPTFDLRRFTQPDGLRAIARDHLLRLLTPFESYLKDCGLTLPPILAADGLDYEHLVYVLMNPTTKTPPALLDALYLVHEMATPDGLDSLIQAAEDAGLSLDEVSDVTAADIAVQVYLQDRDLLERKHAEQYLTRPRSFEYFQTRRRPAPQLRKPSSAVVAALESDLDDWFEKKKRGRGARVFTYPKENETWFLVRHGDPLRREGSLSDGQVSNIFYRPEKYDVLVYEPASGEIRMNACNKGERELFRREFGRHLFHDEEFFPGTGKYTLEPLRVDGEASVVCTDVEGMESVRLSEIQYFWGGATTETEIHRSEDVFAVYTARGRSLPSSARLVRARFRVKFTDSKTPRTVIIRPSNIAQYTRDSDSALVENWLCKRGFVIAGEDDDAE